MYYLLSLFSGAGGATLGASLAGVQPILAIENDPKVADIYRANFDSPILVKDIQALTIEDLKDIPRKYERVINNDFLVIQVSPPCQDYSRANKGRDATSDRANLLSATHWIYKHLAPEAIVLENVPEYASSEAYLAFEQFIIDLGYTVSERVLDAAAYGVAQNRKRFFAVFTNNALPTVNLDDLVITDVVGWKSTIADLINGLEDTELTDKQLEVINSKPDFINSDLLVERVGYYGKPKVRPGDKPAWTLRSHLANDGKSINGRSNVINIVSGGAVKKVDTQVLARLQGFPDSFRWSDEFGLNCHAIGNAIPPLLMQKICELITEND